MNYSEFIEEIKTQVSHRLTNEEQLMVQPMLRNNGTSYDGLTIVRKDCNISPTIYLNPYYHRYLSGSSIEEIYTDILSVYHSNQPQNNFDVRQYTDFRNVHSRIVMRLVHYRKNEHLLSEIPHIAYHDLAIIFACLLDTGDKEHASILIRNNHLSHWNVTVDTLYALAGENTPRLLPLQVIPIEEMLTHYAIPLDTPSRMYILTNEHHLNGASVILYPNTLSRLASEVNSDLILLPSSIHEWIAVLADDNMCMEDYHFMVKEVNETQLMDEEVLSDHAYYYDRIRHTLITCA